MADNTSQAVPRDATNTPLPLTPAKGPLSKTNNASLSSAVDVTLNANTTLLEVSAITAGIFMRYASTASSANFDEFIQAGSTRHFVKPATVTVVSFIQQAASATLILIEK